MNDKYHLLYDNEITVIQISIRNNEKVVIKEQNGSWTRTLRQLLHLHWVCEVLFRACYWSEHALVSVSNKKKKSFSEQVS